LVPHGFRQRARVDYYETFPLVVKLSTLRTVLAITAKRNMHMHSADIESALLNADLQEEIYMHQLKGAEDGKPRVMRLMKSIYGLKQAQMIRDKYTPSPTPSASTDQLPKSTSFPSSRAARVHRTHPPSRVSPLYSPSALTLLTSSSRKRDSTHHAYLHNSTRTLSNGCIISYSYSASNPA
jgi:hypothetical protein